MFTTSLTAALVAFSGIASSHPLDKRQGAIGRRNFRFDYANEKVMGVNLGGWFVLEPWINPGFFDDQPDWVVDEFTLCKNLGPDACRAKLEPHWDTWIGEDDFRQIKAAGMNHVRIPIGYWSIQPNEGDSYVEGAYPYLGRALDLAQGQGLKVMIDLHGAQGSQNGFDNSGQRGDIRFGQGDTVSQARSVLQTLIKDHAGHPAVASIQVVNEPMANTIGKGLLEQLYRDVWGDMKDTEAYTSIHEGFLGVNAWDSTFDGGIDGLLVDTHHYEVFNSDQLKLSPQGHNEAACAFGGQMAANSRPTISGEWTGALTDCTKYLNGRGVGARYDGTFTKGSETSSFVGSCDRKVTGTTAGLNQDEKDNIRNFINAQLDAYEKKSGWIYWTWKTEASPEWDMQDLLAEGIFPNPVTSRNGYRCS